MPAQYEQFKVLSKIILSEEVADAIIKKFDDNLEYKEQQTYRSVYIKDIDINNIDNLKNSVISANNDYYKFNIDYSNVDCFFAKYETGMHYQQLHMDCIAGDLQRKLSFSLLLNDNFEGGDFKLLHDAVIKATKGKLLVFPSFIPHAITPVTAGTRYAIFGWFYGPNFV
jgi:PKHD-type hydroxylase